MKHVPVAQLHVTCIPALWSLKEGSASYKRTIQRTIHSNMIQYTSSILLLAVFDNDMMTGYLVTVQ
eukprot:1598-Heterococcus_DN1.PRE.2